MPQPTRPLTARALTATELSDPGTPDAPKPLLLLGASLGTSTQVLWEPVAALLRDAVHLVAWDLPGHGRSPAATGAFAVADLADAVAELARGIEAPAGRYYAGVSLGGAVGLELGLRHPGLCDGIAVICSGAALGTPDGWRERAATVRAQGTSSLVTASAGRWFAPGWLDAHATLGGSLLNSLTQADDESYARCCEALAGHDVSLRLPQLRDPVLAVAGELDAVAPPALAAQVAGGVRAGRRVTLAGVAHLAPAEDPPGTAAALVDLLGLPARAVAASGPAPAPTASAASAPDSHAAMSHRPASHRPASDKAASHAPDSPATLGVTAPVAVSRGEAPRSGAATDDATLAQVYDAGMAVRREVLGDAHVDAANASIDEVTRDFQEFITRYAWGSIWTRPGLDRVTRSAITLTAMIAGGFEHELAMHLRAARRNGMTREQIVEVLLQSAVYCSVPRANVAFAIAREVLGEEAAPDPRHRAEPAPPRDPQSTDDADLTTPEENR